VKEAHKRSGFFRVGKQGTENLILWEADRARRLRLVHTGPASRRIDRLRLDATDREQE
jgi:hypothetical protein